MQANLSPTGITEKNYRVISIKVLFEITMHTHFPIFIDKVFVLKFVYGISTVIPNPSKSCFLLHINFTSSMFSIGVPVCYTGYCTVLYLC